MRLTVLVLVASLASSGVCAAQARSPNVQLPAQRPLAQQPNLQLAPATALDIQRLSNENQALRLRVDALVGALRTYGRCERIRVQAESEAEVGPGESVKVQPPAALFDDCQGGEEDNLRILEDIQ